MKISMQLLERYLKDYRPDSDIRDDRLAIRGVRFLSDTRLTLSSEYVYLGDAAGYFSDAKYADALLIASGQSHLLCRNCDREALLNDILGAFEYYNTWEQKLLEAALEHAALKTFLDILTSVLGCAAAVFDIEGNLLAVTEAASWREDPEWEEALNRHQMLPHMLAHHYLDADNQPSTDLTPEPRILHAAGDSSAKGMLCVYLLSENEPVAYLMLPIDNRFQAEWIVQLASVFLPLLTKAEEFTASPPRVQSNRSRLLYFLENQENAPDAEEQFVKATGLCAPWQLMVIKNVTTENHTQRSILIRALEKLSTRCLAFDYHASVLVIYPFPRQKDFLNELQRSLRLSAYRIGISMPFHALTAMAMAYRQCLFALQNGQTAGIYSCREYAFSYLLELLRSQQAAMDLLHPAIETLRHYDTINHTELLPTLLAFFQADYQQTRTASTLNIHRNTLKYRLERIRELTDIDFSNATERLYLHLSLLLL